MKKNKHFKKLNFKLNELLTIYFSLIPFFVAKRLKLKINELLTDDLYFILKNLELFDFYSSNKGYISSNRNIFF